MALDALCLGNRIDPQILADCKGSLETLLRCRCLHVRMLLFQELQPCAFSSVNFQTLKRSHTLVTLETLTINPQSVFPWWLDYHWICLISTLPSFLPLFLLPFFPTARLLRLSSSVSRVQTAVFGVDWQHSSYQRLYSYSTGF